jgi:hypothetical protein
VRHEGTGEKFMLCDWESWHFLQKIFGMQFPNYEFARA